MLNILFIPPPADNLLYEGTYDPVLVGLSIVVAIFAAHAALLVSHHVTATKTSAGRHVWVTIGGLCLGFGIWTMHFLGMLAFNLPCTTSYDANITLLSTIPAVLASILAMHIISRPQLTPGQLASGGLLIGAGIGAMHYSGMAAMQISGMIRYDARLFLLSIMVAVVLATFSLWIKFRLQAARDGGVFRVTAVSAVVLGLAVSGMHYTAMLAAYFVRDEGGSAIKTGIAPPFLAMVVLAFTGLIIAVTVVATYIESPKLRSLKRSYKLIGAMLAAWTAIAWVSADSHYGRLADENYRHETKLAAKQIDHVANSIGQTLLSFSGVPLVIARQEEALHVLRRFRANATPSTLPYEERKARWTRDKPLAGVNDSLALEATRFNADAIYILDATGDCIAASNSQRPDSFVGSNYADRDYFIQARAGKHGHQYAYGRTSRVPGLYYSDPIFDGGRLLGVVVAKRNISNFSGKMEHYKAFLADANGVIILAAEKSWEYFALPGATVAQLAPEKRMSQYRQSNFVTLPITPWGGRRYPSAVLVGDNEVPLILSSKTLPENSISVYVPHPLDQLVRLDTERYWLFSLLATAGALLIVVGSAIVIYLRESRKSEIAYRVAATAFEVQQGMTITDANQVVERVNRAFIEITGYDADEIIGKTPRLLSSGRHDAAFYAAMWESIGRTGAWEGEIWNRRKSGEVYPEWLMITAVKDDAGLTTHYVGTFADITERKTAEAEINSLAFYDPLTRLPNRRLLIDRLKQALASSARNHKHGALLFLDLDNFKTLNDTLGHDIGDLLLQQVAQRLSACVREGDTVARLGGDEFVVMLEDMDENAQEAATQAKLAGEKIIAALNEPYNLSNYMHHSTPSIGVTLFSDHRGTIDDLLKQADLAMYQAKAAGRNTLRFFDPEMQAVVAIRAALDADLREAVRKGQFLLYYQAQVDGAGRLTGVEALVRWQHPQRGLVSPLDFIPLAEDTGLILPLGHWVLETACAQLAVWATRSETAHLSVAVNVSARQFHHPDFVDQVLAVLDQTGANPQRLKLELTESLLLSDVEDVIVKMTALKAKGVGFSLDDFGTGYSSLSYLKRLPLDQLKIDRGFVTDILTDANDSAIAKMVVALAESMGLTVIAEGVEIEAQKDFLALHGCLAYQGYLYSRPLPLHAFEAFLKRI